MLTFLPNYYKQLLPLKMRLLNFSNKTKANQLLPINLKIRNIENNLLNSLLIIAPSTL